MINIYYFKLFICFILYLNLSLFFAPHTPNWGILIRIDKVHWIEIKKNKNIRIKFNLFNFYC